MDEAKFKIAKTGARMVEVQFKIDGTKLYHSFVTVKGDGEVNLPGVGQLKRLLEASGSGIEDFDDESQEFLMSMSGLTAKVSVKNELDTYSGQMRARIKSFKPVGEKVEASADNFPI